MFVWFWLPFTQSAVELIKSQKPKKRWKKNVWVSVYECICASKRCLVVRVLSQSQLNTFLPGKKEGKRFFDVYVRPCHILNIVSQLDIYSNTFLCSTKHKFYSLHWTLVASSDWGGGIITEFAVFGKDHFEKPVQFLTFKCNFSNLSFSHLGIWDYFLFCFSRIYLFQCFTVILNSSK